MGTLYFNMTIIYEQLTYFILVYLLNFKREVHLYQINLICGLGITLLTMKHIYEILFAQLIPIAFLFYLIDDVVKSIYLN